MKLGKYSLMTKSKMPESSNQKTRIHSNYNSSTRQEASLGVRSKLSRVSMAEMVDITMKSLDL